MAMPRPIRRLVPIAIFLLIAGAGVARADDQPAAPATGLTVTTAPSLSLGTGPGLHPTPALGLKLPSASLADPSNKGSLGSYDRDAGLAGSGDGTAGLKTQLSAADRDTYFNSRDFQDHLAQPIHPGNKSAWRQVGGAGEAMAINGALMGIGAALGAGGLGH
jgi:hypothetical protein